jgi:hypothetical protein
LAFDCADLEDLVFTTWHFGYALIAMAGRPCAADTHGRGAQGPCDIAKPSGYRRGQYVLHT